MPNVNGLSYQPGYVSSFDDERRITDIVRNKNPLSPTNNLFETNNVKVDNYDLSIHTNRKPVFGQRTHSGPKYSHPNFGGSSFQNPFTGINYLNFGSNLDSDLHSYKTFTVHNGPFEVFSRPIYVYDEASKNKSPANFGFWNDHDTTKHRTTNHRDQHQEFLNNVYKSQGIITRPKQNELVAGNYDFRKVSSRPTIGNSYDFETNTARISNGRFKDTSELWNPGLMAMFHGFGTRITEKSRCEYFNSISLMTTHLFFCQHSFSLHAICARIMRKLSVRF